MAAARFIAIKFKDEYAGDDEKSKLLREEVFQKHVTLLESRPYVTRVRAQYGGQQPMGQGYHYAVIAEYESEEKVTYYNNVDQAHLDVKAYLMPLVQSIFYWAYFPQD